MSKNIRQKIAHAIQTTFRSSSSSSSFSPSSQNKQSSPKSKISSCCSVSKPKDYEFITYQPKPTSTKNNDYVDLSECHSWSFSSSLSSSSSRDSGISFNTNISSVSSSNTTIGQLQSTRIHEDSSCSLSSLSDLSCIPHNEMNISNFDVTTWYPTPTSFECCHCQCHHHHYEMHNYLYIPEESRQKRAKFEYFPFIL